MFDDVEQQLANDLEQGYAQPARSDVDVVFGGAGVGCAVGRHFRSIFCSGLLRRLAQCGLVARPGNPSGDGYVFQVADTSGNQYTYLILPVRVAE